MNYRLIINWLKHRFNKNIFIYVTILSLFYLTFKSQAQQRPNVILIMVDDMGFSDIGSYGGEINTPNIDSLAAHGLRFTQFYNCARCCPTRASMLTGLYQHQVGLRLNGKSLNRNGATLAELLGTAGYNTAMVGKWHLSTTPTYDPETQLKWLNHQVDMGPFSDTITYPCKRGFMEHYGIIWGVANHFDPFSLVHNTQAVPTVPSDYYFTDAISDKAVEYIDQFCGSQDPFFLYIAFTAPHWPLHAKDADINKYAGTYNDGWQPLRERRYNRQIAMELFPQASTPLSDPVIPNDWSPEPQKEWFRRVLTVHAAMVDCIDQGIGRIVEKLKDKGAFENTIIFFLSDNGASPERPTQPGYDRNSETRDGTPVIYDMSAMAGPETSYCGMGTKWANAVNTPFKYYKAESYEGGICTPCIVHWPNGLQTQEGAITTQLAHVIDIMPTVLEYAEVTYPSSYKGHNLLPVEGISLAPIFRDEIRDGHDAIFWEHENGKAVRQGKWKLVALRNGSWELYNLETDRTETNNLAGSNPQKVTELQNLWQQWWNRVIADSEIEPSIRLLSPAQNDTWESGAQKLIRWVTTGGLYISQVKLEYCKDQQTYSIAGSTEHDGVYEWVVPQNVGTNLKMRISTVLDNETLADSVIFNITTPIHNGGVSGDIDRSIRLYIPGRSIILPDFSRRDLQSCCIIDISGRRIAQLKWQGDHLYWNGRSDSGLLVASGVYFIYVSTAKNNKIFRMFITLEKKNY